MWQRWTPEAESELQLQEPCLHWYSVICKLAVAGIKLATMAHFARPGIISSMTSLWQRLGSMSICAASKEAARGPCLKDKVDSVEADKEDQEPTK